MKQREPNLQNIPIYSELGRQIRKGFISPRAFPDIDYSEIEKRILETLTRKGPP